MGRKAMMFQQAIQAARRRQHAEVTKNAGDNGVKNLQEKVRQAFEDADAA